MGRLEGFDAPPRSANPQWQRLLSFLSRVVADAATPHATREAAERLLLELTRIPSAGGKA